MKPIFAALFDQLEIRTRDQFAFSALLRHREVLGESEFSRLSGQMEPRQRNTFRTLGQSYENKDFHLSKKRSKDGVSFGMVPNSIINKLLDKHNRTMRAEGAIMLKRQLEKEATDAAVSPEQTDRFGLLLPYVGSFIKFLGGLLSDASPKVIYKCIYYMYPRIHARLMISLLWENACSFFQVVLHVLECHDVLLNNVPQAMNQNVVQTVHNLLKISVDAKVQIKIELFRLVKSMMKASTPQMVIDVLLPELEHKNARMREDVVNFIIFALLTFPSQEFNLLEICVCVTPCLLDTKRRVRQAGLECMAIIHQVCVISYGFRG